MCTPLRRFAPQTLTILTSSPLERRSGTGVPGTFCADHYDALWGIYVDWTVGGIYTCKCRFSGDFQD